VAIRWRSCSKGLPAEGEFVLVYNGRHVWSTKWRDAFVDASVKVRVTRWAPLSEVGLPMNEPDAVVDCHTETFHNIEKRRRA